ncbi:glycosyltransferase [Agromyces sp. CFH 90414]|uniref:Glycosyltransferase n=1 Tax=Agromyces agglutinans TaxID=2662258 RepID=A0A6I2F8G8_9MICO|nr:glycosyltransferase [Agromyces agglutinans]MRG60544.1 glycosyltransferase [Agromyces agglutinans]
MSAIDAELAARIEVWIETAGTPFDSVEASIASVRAAGVPGSAIRLLLGSGSDVRDELSSLAAGAGIETMSDAAAALDARLGEMSADTVFIVRWGTVTPDVVHSAVGFLDRNPSLGLAYGDSVTPSGIPLLRPAASPIRLRSNDYLGPIVVVRTAALRAIGGFRVEAERAHVLDIALRLDEAGWAFGLLPLVLSTEELARKDFAETALAQERVVRSALERVGVGATIEEVEPFVRRVRYEISGEPLVSIVIPTRGGAAEIAGRHRVLVVEAIRGIVERSSYSNLEFVVVADDVTPDSVIRELRELCGDRLRLVLWDAPFNFSAKMNRGAVMASGEYLLLLNDDVEVVTDDWIETMLGLAQQRGVGIVGSQLYFEDSTIQHAGQVYTGGVAGHAAFGWVGGRDDSIKSMITDHEVSGVTAACAMIARDLYLEVGGFTLELPGNYNDVDLNMKVRQTGRSAVFTPWARLYHFESKTRDPRILPTDLETLQARWKRRMQVELYSRML